MADVRKTYTALQFEASQWTSLISKLQKKWKDVEKRKEFATLISAPVFSDIMDHYQKEEGPQGRWKSWSNTYADHMKRIGRSQNKILQFNGRLRQSFKPTNFRTSQQGVTFYNNAKIKSSGENAGFPYAFAHDEGGPKLPQRKFMWLSASGMTRIIKVVEGWLAEGT